MSNDTVARGAKTGYVKSNPLSPFFLHCTRAHIRFIMISIILLSSDGAWKISVFIPNVRNMFSRVRRGFVFFTPSDNVDVCMFFRVTESRIP